MKTLAIQVDEAMHSALVVRLNELRVEVLGAKMPEPRDGARVFNEAQADRARKLNALTMRSLCVALMGIGFGQRDEHLEAMMREARTRGRPYGAQEPFEVQSLASMGVRKREDAARLAEAKPSPFEAREAFKAREAAKVKPAPAKPAKPKTARQLAREAKQRAQDAEDRRLSQEARDNLPEFLRD